MDRKFIAFAVAFIALTAYSSIYFYSDNEYSVNDEYREWKTKFGFRVESEFEDLYRERVFTLNVNAINQHNADPKRTYNQGINQFTGLTQKQCEAMFLNDLRVPQLNTVNIGISDYFEETNDDQVDWRVKGAVTPITNQGQCGSSPYFSAVYALEGLMKIADGSLDVLSVQQILDCTGDYGNYGCNGGWMVASFQYVIDKGITTNKTYPYKGVQQRPCQKVGGQFKITGYVQIASKDCNALAKGLLVNPIATAADATNWFKYESGIFSDCKQTSPNHGIAMIGMTSQYWIMKNTWDTTWGQKGYIRLARGNTCGVCAFASYPTK